MTTTVFTPGQAVHVLMYGVHRDGCVLRQSTSIVWVRLDSGRVAWFHPASLTPVERV